LEGTLNGRPWTLDASEGVVTLRLSSVRSLFALRRSLAAARIKPLMRRSGAAAGRYRLKAGALPMVTIGADRGRLLSLLISS